MSHAVLPPEQRDKRRVEMISYFVDGEPIGPLGFEVVMSMYFFI